LYLLKKGSILRHDERFWFGNNTAHLVSFWQLSFGDKVIIIGIGETGIIVMKTGVVVYYMSIELSDV